MSSFVQRLLLRAAATVGILGCGVAAAEAPRELFNKTISISWNEYRVQRADSGEIKKGNTSSTLLVYVGELRRLFTRLSRQGRKRSNSNDLDPREEINARALALRETFPPASRDGSCSSATRCPAGLAASRRPSIRPMRAAGFRFCFGKEGGSEIRHRAMDGRMYNIVSTDVSGQSCSVRAGNVFAVR